MRKILNHSHIPSNWNVLMLTMIYCSDHEIEYKLKCCPGYIQDRGLLAKFKVLPQRGDVEAELMFNIDRMEAANPNWDETTCPAAL